MDTRSRFGATLCISPLFAFKDTTNLRVPTSLVYDPRWPRRHPAEDDKERCSTRPPICHVFLRVCAAAAFDEWEEHLGHLYPLSVTHGSRAVKTRGGDQRQIGDSGLSSLPATLDERLIILIRADFVKWAQHMKGFSAANWTERHIWTEDPAQRKSNWFLLL